MTDMTKAAVPGGTQPEGRRAFLRQAALLGFTGAATVASTATAAITPESLDLREQFIQIREHESAHVAGIVEALGASARPKPTFRGLVQTNYVRFLQVALALENTGVGAYLGATPAISSRAILASAASIALIEARHAGFVNDALNLPVTGGIKALKMDRDFEEPLTAAEVVELAGGFIADLNGGPPVTYSSDPADFGETNDVAILNFALALEYLEAEFYAVNVPRIFRRRR